MVNHISLSTPVRGHGKSNMTLDILSQEARTYSLGFQEMVFFSHDKEYVVRLVEIKSFFLMKGEYAYSKKTGSWYKYSLKHKHKVKEVPASTVPKEFRAWLSLLT